jgi:hypothetical protein
VADPSYPTWLPLAVYAARQLPFPGEPPRVGERLGADRRLTMFHDQHSSGQIRIRESLTGREVAPTEWVNAEFALDLLIGPRWEKIGPVQVLAAAAAAAGDDIVARLIAFMNHAECMSEASAFDLVCQKFRREAFTMAQWREARRGTHPEKKFRRGHRK